MGKRWWWRRGPNLWQTGLVNNGVDLASLTATSSAQKQLEWPALPRRRNTTSDGAWHMWAILFSLAAVNLCKFFFGPKESKRRPHGQVREVKGKSSLKRRERRSRKGSASVLVIQIIGSGSENSGQYTVSWNVWWTHLVALY